MSSQDSLMPTYGPGPLGGTNPMKWRLDSSDSGRHVWHYVEGQEREKYDGVWGDDAKGVMEREQTKEELYWLGLGTHSPALDDANGDPARAARNGWMFYRALQAEDAFTRAEFWIGIVFAMYITETPIPPEWKIEITRYLANTQRKGEGGDRGWGVHTERPSSVFCTVLNYVALRILGVSADHPMVVDARNTLQILGGPLYAPTWAKFWLACMNVYEWGGINCPPPELFILPQIVPFHPSKWWIHTRRVYGPVSYLAAKKFQTSLTPLLSEIRKEIYQQEYSSILWKNFRSTVTAEDLYCPLTRIAKFGFAAMSIWDDWVCPAFIREKGIQAAYQHVIYDDENTQYQTIGPVSKAFNMIVRYVEEGPHSVALREHRLKIRDFMVIQLRVAVLERAWNDGHERFAALGHSLLKTDMVSEPADKAAIEKAYNWIDDCQIKANPKWFREDYRHQSQGGWPFSTREQSYPVSDTTAEALRTVLGIHGKMSIKQTVSKERLCDAVDVILSLQNPNSGFSGYELVRGGRWLEWLNSSEVFSDVMTDVCHTECSSSAVCALASFSSTYADYRKTEVSRAMTNGIVYILSQQRTDGSWYGNWGICFTYAAMFTLEALAAVGQTYANSAAVRKACEFLLSKQRKDGGWGESYLSCEKGEYVDQESQVCNTAYCVLALLYAKYPEKEPIKRGCKLIMSRQQPDGSWLQEAIEGVFNKNCAIT
ncbi:terpene synthase [Atractiella rhizophila]|nr:terpene synthase [Atractiella rhizophila]